MSQDYADKVLEAHLETSCKGVRNSDFIIMDGTDISKKHAKYMEGLEFVKNGDTSEIGLGYNVLNINAVGIDKEITPLYSKAYSYEMGALSSNNEIKKAVSQLKAHLHDKGCWVFDRAADNEILKDFFFSESSKCIIRLKQNTKLAYKGEQLKVSQIANRISFDVRQTVTKIKKDKKVLETYELGVVKVSCSFKGKTHLLWLVVSRNQKHGGLCYLLVKSPIKTPIEVAIWTFNGYGLRWKIEEYHRHIKQEYKLEDIQIKTFSGLQSLLAIITAAMFFIYKKIQSIHIHLLLDAGYDYLNKHTLEGLTNFIYYKISKVVANLLMPVRVRWNSDSSPPNLPSWQIKLEFD